MRARSLLLLLLVFLAGACRDDAPLTPLRALHPGALNGLIVRNQGGLGDSGFDQWSASGTYNNWPPTGWSLMAPTDGYGSSGVPCAETSLEPLPQPPGINGSCNAGEGKLTFGIFGAATPWDPTPGAAGIGVLATHDLDDGFFGIHYPVIRSAVKIDVTIPATGRQMLGFDYAFLTGQKDGGAASNDFASLEFRPDGEPAVELFRINRNALQPGGTGPLTSLAHRNGDGTFGCGTGSLSHALSFTYPMCTDWTNVQTDLTARGFGGKHGFLVFRLEEVGVTYDQAAGGETERPPSALAMNNVMLKDVPPARAIEGSAVTIGDAALEKPPLSTLVEVRWTFDPSRCSILPGEEHATSVHLTCRDNGLAPAWQYFIYLNTTSGLPNQAARIYQPVEFANAPPVLGEIQGLPNDAVPAGTVITASAAFTDPGTLDTHTGTVTWDDGEAPAAASITETNGAGTVSASRALPTGVYTVSLRVVDDDGGEAAVSSDADYVVVTDVTDPSFAARGRGWIESRRGAFPRKPNALGRAYFGFIAKFVNGAIVPCKDTKFRFRGEDFEFASTQYDALALGGARVQYSGIGTVNGNRGFSFQVTAVDGEAAGTADKFRMKIWNTRTGVVIYDSGLGAPDDGPSGLLPLGRGRIKIRVR